MATSDEDRVNLLGNNMLGDAARAKALRGKQIDNAVDGTTVPGEKATPANGSNNSQTSVDFTRPGPKPTPAMQKAKQAKLIEKLRARDVEDKSSFANGGDF